MNLSWINAYCLILDKRLHFWNELSESFLEKGIALKRFLVGDGSLTNEVYDHVDIKSNPYVYHNSINYRTWYTPPPYNAFLSHQKILKKSLDEGQDHVLIVEDDVFIENDFNEILEGTMGFFAIKDDWDAIYFGGYHREGSWSPTTNEHVMKLHGSGGWHGVLLRKKIMEELVNAIPIGPYDWQMGEFYHNRYNCYGIYPSIISQKSGFSYVENSNLDKPSRYIR